MSARKAALGVVLRVFEDDAYADRALRSATKGFTDRDRAFAMEVVYGTVRYRRLLDYAVEEISRRSVEDFDPPVRAAIRIGAYQLCFMNSVPDHAAVSETVELVRESGLNRAVGFTNAIMRRLTEQMRPLIEGIDDSTVDSAALKYSYPEWIAQIWWKEFGSDSARQLMAAQNRPAEVAVRVNHRKIPVPSGCPPVQGKHDDSLPYSLVVDRVPDEWISSGLVWPQSRGSQLAGCCVGSKSGERVLDLCAAPGGKATQLMGDVIAVESDVKRAFQLKETVRSQHAKNVKVFALDARDLPSDFGCFDRVLVDAPCSGLGVLQSRPDLRWRSNPLPDLQLELLKVALERVRPGGTVTYSVCTMSRAETEVVVDSVGAKLDDLGSLYPQFRHPRRPECLLTLPHKHGTSGFFIARLRKDL